MVLVRRQPAVAAALTLTGVDPVITVPGRGQAPEPDRRAGDRRADGRQPARCRTGWTPAAIRRRGPSCSEEAA
jgi:hypothetical protein